MIDSATTANHADDNLDANFGQIVPPECKKNHPMYVAYKLAYASTQIQKQCKYCGNMVYIGTDTEEELKKIPIPTWFTPSDAEDRCGILKVYRCFQNEELKHEGNDKRCEEDELRELREDARALVEASGEVNGPLGPVAQLAVVPGPSTGL